VNALLNQKLAAWKNQSIEASLRCPTPAIHGLSERTNPLCREVTLVELLKDKKYLALQELPA